MRRMLIKIGLVGVALVAAVAVNAGEEATWGTVKAAVEEQEGQPRAKKGGIQSFVVTATIGNIVHTDGQADSGTWAVAFPNLTYNVIVGSENLELDLWFLNFKKQGGNFVAARVWFKDSEENQYKIKDPAPIDNPQKPGTASFTLEIAATLDVVPVQPKNAPSIGTVSIGDIVFDPVPSP